MYLHLFYFTNSLLQFENDKAFKYQSYEMSGMLKKNHIYLLVGLSFITRLGLHFFLIILVACSNNSKIT